MKEGPKIMNWTPAVASILAAREITATPSEIMSSCNPVAQLLWSTARDLDSVESDLRSKTAYIQRELENLTKHLDAGLHINGLGILQSTGQQLDILAARRQDLVEQLNRVAVTFVQTATALS